MCDPKTKKTTIDGLPDKQDVGTVSVNCGVPKSTLESLVELVPPQSTRETRKWVQGPSKSGSATGLEFVSRDGAPDARIYRQYVNTDKVRSKLDVPKRPAHGRHILLKAKVPGTAKAGQKVLFEAKFNGQQPWEKLEKKIRGGFKNTNGKLTYEGKSRKDGWTEEIKFYFATHPGDTFEIRARLAGEYASLSLGPYEVWRKVWYEVDTMQGIGAADAEHWDPAVVQKAFDPVHIELEKHGPDGKPEKQECTEGKDIKTYGDRLFKNRMAPLQLHIILLNSLIEKLKTPVFKSVKVKGGEREGALRGRPPPDGSNCFYKPAESKAWFEDAYYTLKKDGVQGRIALTKDEAYLTAIDAVQDQLNIKINDTRDVPAGQYTVTTKVWLVQLLAGAAIGLHTPVSVGLWNCTQEGEVAKKKIHGTIIHETGHMVGMVPQKQKTHIKESGHHCKSVKCVMYKEQLPCDRPVEFCDDCRESLRNMQIDRLKPVGKA